LYFCPRPISDHDPPTCGLSHSWDDRQAPVNTPGLLVEMGSH
jgi:hypothetical protein